jgi:hypothetical protein
LSRAFQNQNELKTNSKVWKKIELSWMGNDHRDLKYLDMTYRKAQFQVI